MITLSPRELDVLRLVVEGMTTREIAHRFGTGEKTVKSQLTSIYNKLGVNGRTQAAVIALRSGVLT